MLSIISLLMVLTLSILVTRIATVVLTHTGLARESAKFQARSAFTGVGFTTTESEKADCESGKDRAARKRAGCRIDGFIPNCSFF